LRTFAGIPERVKREPGIHNHQRSSNRISPFATSRSVVMDSGQPLTRLPE